MCKKITMKSNVLDDLDQKELYKLFKMYPNYFDLGGEVREKFKSKHLNRLYPNDYDLGDFISSFFINKNE